MRVVSETMCGPIVDGCDWPISLDNTCCPGACQADPGLVADMVSVVSAMMRLWSGNRIGLCAGTLRPVGYCGVCRSKACCGAADGIHLTGPDGTPISSVTGVWIDGEPLDEWRYDPQGRMLYRADGGRWPIVDDKSLPDDIAGLRVDIVTGIRPDAWAIHVARTLLCELVTSCVGDGQACRLPRNATSITRQGIRVQLKDSEIQHLLPEVSAWVAAVNPAGARSPARVLTPPPPPSKYGRMGWYG